MSTVTRKQVKDAMQVVAIRAHRGYGDPTLHSVAEAELDKLFPKTLRKISVAYPFLDTVRLFGFDAGEFTFSDERGAPLYRNKNLMRLAPAWLTNDQLRDILSLEQNPFVAEED